MSQKISPEPISVGGEVVAIVLRSTMAEEHRDFVTDTTDQLQFGAFKLNANTKIPPHRHLPVERNLLGTPEFLFVQAGKLTVSFYDVPEDVTGTITSESVCFTTDLEAGQAILIFGGTHGFVTKEGCEFFELKQGPYAGLKDKIKFELN